MDSLPMKIHQEDIAWYLETAMYLRTALEATARLLKPRQSVTSNYSLQREFVSHILAVYPEAELPFAREKNTLGEPFSHGLCVSVNECVAHGKNKEEIFPGDNVSLDGGVSLVAPTGRSMYFDAAITVIAGSRELSLLAEAPLTALKRISSLEGDINTAQIAAIIESIAKENDLGIVTGLTGHGIGYGLHVQPRIPNVPTPNMTSPLLPGTFICPEPMYTANGAGLPVRLYLDTDGWSVMVDDVSSHWETTFYYDGDTLMDTIGILSNY